MLYQWDEVRIFLYHHEIDMRYGFERLSHLVRREFQSNLLEGDVYLFLGKNRKRAKILWFDGTGLMLATKRLEKGKLMNVHELKERETISARELSYLLSGARLLFSKAA